MTAGSSFPILEKTHSRSWSLFENQEGPDVPLRDLRGEPHQEGRNQIWLEFLKEPNTVDEERPSQGGAPDLKSNSNGRSTRIAANLSKCVVPQRPTSVFREDFNALQKWEGFVIEVKAETFTARLVRIKGNGPDQEAEIYLQEVDPEDIPLIKPGALFFWNIGYNKRPSGVMRASVLRFRRLPKWDQRDLKIAKNKAIELKGLLDGK
jgi:hypothetical protein